MFTSKYYDTHTFGYTPQTFTNIKLNLLDGLKDQAEIKVNVAGWEKDEIEVAQDGQYVTVTMSAENKGTSKKVYVGNSKVSKATYKAGMLTLHFEDTSNVIPIE